MSLNDALTGSTKGLSVSLNRMPDGSGSQSTLTTNILVNEDGQVADCFPVEQGQVTLGAIACQQVRELWAPYKVEVRGHPQRSVQTVFVHFEATR